MTVKVDIILNVYNKYNYNILITGVGGFLPAVKQIGNVAALPGIVGVCNNSDIYYCLEELFGIHSSCHSNDLSMYIDGSYIYVYYIGTSYVCGTCIASRFTTILI